MYLLKKFAGDNFERINLIIDSYNNFQNGYVNLIASASYIFPELITAMQYPLSTLPTEGFAPFRYFPANQYMDDIESVGEQLCLKLFKISSGYRVNLQPHSGTQANHIVYNAILKDNDVVLSLSSNDGGHISHSKFANGTIKVINYTLEDGQHIDFEQIEAIAKQHKPKLIIAGTTSFPREIDFQRFSQIANKCNSYLLADVSHTAVFIAGGVHKNIFPYVDFATFTMEKNLRGPHGGIVIYKDSFHKQICYSTFPVSQGGPIQNMLLAKLVAFHILDTIDVKTYATDIKKNAVEICQNLMRHGFKIVTDGTDSHMILIDLSKSKLDGKQAEDLLQRNLILANRNLIPGDRRPPLITSGIRLGSTAITNLNYQKADIILLSDIISNVLNQRVTDPIEMKYLINKYHAQVNTANEEKS